MNADKIPLCAIVGPTASGKTDLAVQIALQNHGEIVSFDSMQIYKEAPIATAVPTIEERQGVPHHLMEFLSCNEQFSVARYTELAHKVISDIHKRGHLPVLVGGTGLYYSSLLDHLQFSKEDNSHLDIRKKLNERLFNEGIEALYSELKNLDPLAASKIHINNHVRVLRALEVYYSTGKTMSQQVEQSRSIPSPYNPCVIGLTFRNRELLYDRINLRVEQMVAAGVIEEIKKIYEINPNGTLMQAIGVKEWIPFFEKKAGLDDTIEAIQRSTRHYAKRQLTWFRRDERVHWLYRDDFACADNLILEAQMILDQHFS